MKILFLGNMGDECIQTIWQNEIFLKPTVMESDWVTNAELVDPEQVTPCVQLISLDENGGRVVHFRVIHLDQISDEVMYVKERFKNGNFFLVGGNDFSPESQSLLAKIKSELDSNGINYDSSNTGGNVMRNTKVTRQGLTISEKQFIGGQIRIIENKIES